MKPHSLIPLLAAVAVGSPAALAEDKPAKGTITITVEKDGKTETRTLHLDTDSSFHQLTEAVEKLQGTGGGEAPAPAKKVTYLGVMLADKLGAHGIGFIGGFEGGAGLGGGAGLFGGPAEGGGSGSPPSATPGLPPGTGLTVTGVTPEGPAAKAGLQAGDVLARLNDQTLVNPDQFTTLIRNMKEGEVVRLALVRGSESKELEATLESREESPAPTRLPLLGEIPQIARLFTLDADGKVIETPPVPPAPPVPPVPPAPDLSSATPVPPTAPLPLNRLLQHSESSPVPPGISKALRDAAEAKEKWAEQLAKWRDDWAANQDRATEEYRKAIEGMKKDLERARADADNARQEALKAVEDIRRELEKRKSDLQPPTPPAPASPAPADPPKKA